jgi:hypothetical protein
MKKLLLISVILTKFVGFAQTFTNQISTSGLNPKQGRVHEVFDYNNDGFEDLIYSNLISNVMRLRVMKNNQNLTFTNVTTSLGLDTGLVISDSQTSSSTLTAFDYDNDGYKDIILLQTPASVRVFKNNQGLSFAEKTSALGIINPMASTTLINSFSSTSDYDRDGDVDILFSRTLSNGNRVLSVLKNNITTNTFSIVDLLNAVDNTTIIAQIRTIDFDNDQDDDILFIQQQPKTTYAASQGYFSLQTIKLYANNGLGNYTDVTSSSGLTQAFSRNGATVFDYDNDGWLDILFGSDDGYTSNPTSAFIKFYKNNMGSFADSSINVLPTNNQAYYWYSSTVDVENDGDYDVYHGVGRCAQTKNEFLINNTYRFSNKASDYGLDLAWTFCSGNGANVWFDADNDGDMDVFVSDFTTNANSYLMINPLNSTTSKYLKVKIHGCESNKDGIGSKVSVKMGTKQQSQYNGYSIGSNIKSSDVFHFGLGSNTKADTLIVKWPKGKVTKIANIAANQMLDVYENAGVCGTCTTVSTVYNPISQVVTVYDHISVSDTLRIKAITGINDVPLDFGTMRVYPNPTNSHIVLDAGNVSGNYSIKITNSLSQTVYTSSVSKQLTTINLSTLGGSGVYYLQVLDNSNKILDTKKLVLE